MISYKTATSTIDYLDTNYFLRFSKDLDHFFIQQKGFFFQFAIMISPNHIFIFSFDRDMFYGKKIKWEKIKQNNDMLWQTYQSQNKILSNKSFIKTYMQSTDDLLRRKDTEECDFFHNVFFKHDKNTQGLIIVQGEEVLNIEANLVFV